MVIGMAVSASCGGRSVLDPDDINADGLGAADDPNNDGSNNDSTPGDSGGSDSTPGDSGGGSDGPGDGHGDGPGDGRPGDGRPGDDRPGDDRPGGGGDSGGFPGGDGPAGEVIQCMSCVQSECPELMECLTDAECRDGLMCIAQDCLGGGGGGGFDPMCMMGCFGGNIGAAMGVFQGFQCAMNECPCDSLLDLAGGLGGDGGGFPGSP